MLCVRIHLAKRDEYFPAVPRSGGAPLFRPTNTPFIRVGLIVCLLSAFIGRATAGDLQVLPATVQLDGSFERAQLLVVEGAATPSERTGDLTHQATYQSSNPQVVSVSRTGQLLS